MRRAPFGKGAGDVFYPSLMAATVIVASTWARVSPSGAGPDMTLHLGGEYRCIAEAIAAGRGFSDPFGVPTGPTAWMPPVFPSLMAVLLMAGGSIRAVADAVGTLQNLVLIYMGILVLRFASPPGAPRGSRLVALVAYVGAISCHHYYYFRFTHDHVLVGLWVCLLVDLADRFHGRPPRLLAVSAWGVAGGLSALTAPVLGPVWAALTVTLAVAARRTRWLAASALVAGAIVAPWMARNASVFHHLVPVKSNLAFELYQSQCLEPDGVLRQATTRAHPFLDSGGEERRLYASRGEMAYMDEKRREFLRSVREDPSGYAKRVVNRLAAATVSFVPYDDGEAAAGLAGRLLHPLPFAGMLLTLAASAPGRDHRKILIILLYLTYILPYIFVSYYERYIIPLDIARILFCVWGWQAASLAVSRGGDAHAPDVDGSRRGRSPRS